MNQKHFSITTLVNYFQQEGNFVLLESQMENHPSSNRSYIAAKPLTWIKTWGTKVEIFNGEDVRSLNENPWNALNKYQNNAVGNIFGYLGYDLKNWIENLRSENVKHIGSPDLFFFEPGFLAEINSKGDIKVLKGVPPEPIAEIFADFSIELVSQVKKEEYLRIVNFAKEQIREGDYYEINLSHPLVFNFEGDPWALYKAMKEVGPVPFASFMKLDDFYICSSSPERFLAKEGSRVWSQPIKGTIRREKGKESKLINELKSSEKERAENLMIVDLVRNDMSRVAKKGTVKVKELFEIQSFETVHQMVSTVECEVEKDTDIIEIIKACFPMGSMTGAPKIAAMQAIEKLENYQRGIYSGAIGYIQPNGDFDFSVVIRSAIIQDNKLLYPVGGAITSDSDPQKEWEETFLKAMALTRVIKNFPSV